MARPSITIQVLHYGRHPSIDVDSLLPSVQPQSLTLLTYMTMCGVPFDSVEANDPHQSPSGDLPVLVVDGHSVATGLGDCIAWLKKSGYQLTSDAQMPDSEKADARAFISLIEDRLHLCQLYNWFGDAENYSSWTLNAFAQRRRFPLNWWYPRKTKREVLERLKFVAYTSENEQQIYQLAQEIYVAVAAKLGDKSYLFGDHPTTADAFLFGFLTTQVTAKVPNAQLSNLIRGHRNLVDYTNRILDNYFSPKSSPSLNRPEINYKPLQVLQDKKDADQPQETAEEKERRAMSTYFILGGSFALFAYAVIFNEQTRDYFYGLVEEEQLTGGVQLQ